MLQELCCCLLLFSGVAPSDALRPTTENILDFNTEGQFSLEKTLKEEPSLPANLISDMRGVIEETLLKGLPELPVQPGAHDPELQGQVASMLQKVQASSLEEIFAEHAEVEKIPAENTQVLLEMGSSMKKVLNHPQLVETISGQVSKVQKFVGEHPAEIDSEIKRYVEHARPSQHSTAQPVPPSLMEELPVLAKKLLPMFKPSVLGMGQSDLSLLQSSSNTSVDPKAKPFYYTRFETAVSLTFPLPCTSDACFTIPVSIVMVKLHPAEGKSGVWAKGPGFIFISPGVKFTFSKASLSISPFIPINASWTGFLGAMKTGFAVNVGWKASNLTALADKDKGPPELKISMGCSYLPISVESKKFYDANWGARTEPMIEFAGGYDFAAEKWSVATAFKLRSAISYQKDQYFFIFKFGLGSFKGDEVKLAGPAGGITVGLLYHMGDRSW